MTVPPMPASDMPHFDPLNLNECVFTFFCLSKSIVYCSFFRWKMNHEHVALWRDVTVNVVAVQQVDPYFY